MVTLTDIYAARERVREHVVHTPLRESVTLGQICGRRVFCKFENLQMIGAFKERGALNRLLQLSEAEKRQGVIAASAGNHAQALAYHGQRLGVPVTIIMPKNTPLVKVVHTEMMGARVIQTGATFDDAADFARNLRDDEDLTLIHAFEDAAVIAGQGTIGLELMEDRPDLDSVLVPVGGGGLIAGMAIAIKSQYPKVRIIGVEAELVPSMATAVYGRPHGNTRHRTIADGIAVYQVGHYTSSVVKELVDDLMTVTESQIAHAIQLLLEIEKTFVEGAGAVGLATLIHHPRDMFGEKSAIILSGGNMDISMLAKVIEKGLIAEGRLCRLTIRVSDVPGSLAAVTGCISEMQGNIQEVSHQRAFSDAPVGEVQIELTIETRSSKHVDEIISALVSRGYRVRKHGS